MRKAVNPFAVLGQVFKWLFRVQQRLNVDPRTLRVIDGDTIEYLGIRYRLMGYDTPEIFSASTQYEYQQGLAAKALLRSHINNAHTAQLICYEPDR